MKEVLRKILPLFFKYYLPFLFIFFIFLFPIRDLRHIITAKVAEATQNNVIIEFEDIGLNIIPRPAIQLTNTQIIARGIPNLKFEDLSISPSFLGLLTFKPGATISSNNLFGGRMNFSFRQSSSNENAAAKQSINLNLQNLSSQRLNQTFNFPFDVRSNINLVASGIFDPSFQDSDLSASLQTDSLQTFNLQIPTDLGSITIPNINISQINIEADFKKRRIEFQRAEIGREGDSIHGNIEGHLDLNIMQSPQGLRIADQAMNLSIRLKVANSFLNDLEVAPFLDSFAGEKTMNDTSFRLQVQKSMGQAPRITKIP